MKEHDPTAKAVAVQWDWLNAPRVTASGSGATAEEILRVAAEHDVPLQSDPILAEALAQIPIGEEIPQALYVAVAEVLSFVFALEGIVPEEPRILPASESDKSRRW